MSVKAHEAFSMDSFMNRLLWFDDFHGDQIQDEWNEAGTGSAAVIDTQTGGIIRLTTGAINGDAYNLNWNDIRSLLVLKKVTGEFRAKLNATVAEIVQFLLIFDGTNLIRFIYNAAVDANWHIETIDGGASTNQDSGIAADTDYHTFRIECFPTGEVHFYIDNTETTNSPITTNIPDDAGDYLQPHIYIRTTEDIAKSVDIDYVYIRQER